MEYFLIPNKNIKMKNYTMLFSFLFSFILYSQEGNTKYKIDYDMYINLGQNTKYNASLIFDNQQSIYSYKADDIKPQEIDEEYSVQLILIDSTGFFNYINRLEDRLVESTKSTYSKNKYLIEEKIPKLNWTITEETKKIANYECVKAKTYFRGRNYEAWFTKDIPVWAGPWKFSGLLGLILEVYDTEKKVFITAKKIKFPYVYSFDDSKIDNSKTISRSDYLEFEKKEEKEFENRMMSKFDRGMKIQMNFKRESIEIPD